MVKVFSMSRLFRNGLGLGFGWLVILILLCMTVIPVHGQDEYTEFYSESLRTTNTGMYVLGGWAGDRADFFLFGGVDFATFDDAGLVLVGADDTSFTAFMVKFGLCYEVYFGDNFSVGADHGFALRSLSPPGDGDSSTDFGTFSDGLTEVSFTYYLDKN